MSSPETLVTNAFDNAQEFAEEAMELVDSFLNSFASNLYTAPLVDIVWTAVDVPTFDDLPDVPSFDAPTFEMPAAPEALAISAPDISISEFSTAAPAVDLSGMPVLEFGDKPEIVIGDAPAVYSPSAPSVPDAPVVDDVATPTLLDFTAPTFNGIDTHQSFLDDLTAALPDVDLVAPTAYTYNPGTAYTSPLKTAIANALAARIAGGTGLDAGVEAAIWGRDSDRTTNLAQASIDEANEAGEALGWSIPPGAVTAAGRRARQNMRNQLAGKSRDVAIKQAELEQANIQKTLDQGIQWEGQLIQYSLELEKIAFESAKVVAQNAIDIHNAGVERFRVIYQGAQVRAQVYDTIINAEQLKVEELKGYIAVEEAKAQINNALVNQYRAEIDGRLAVVRVYEARLAAVRTLVDIEKTKVEASAESIRGFIASVNAKTAELEVYKVGVSAEQVKAEAWRTLVQGQGLGVEAYRAAAEAFRAKSGAEAEKSRALVSRYQALYGAKEAEFKGYSALVEAQRAKAMSASDIARALLAAYEANTRAIEARANTKARLFEAQTSYTKAQAEYVINGQKINSDIIAHNRQVVLDASKTAAQVVAQIAGSAMAQAHANVGISGSSNNSVSYSYSNDTATAPPSVTVV